MKNSATTSRNTSNTSSLLSTVALTSALALAALGSGCNGDGDLVVTTTSSTVTVSSTSSTSSTTTSSTSTTSTSTTTLPGSSLEFTFSTPDSELDVHAIGFSVDYSALASLGGFFGDGSSVNCTATPLGAESAFNNDSSSSTLSAGIIHVTGFNTPAELASCEFRTTLPFLPDPATLESDFILTVTEASGPGLVPIVPLPSVDITAGDVTLPTTTTTLAPGSTTTTTVGVTTTTSTTTTTLPAAGNWEIGLRLDDAVTFGSLTFTLDYSTASGEMVGSGADVQCAIILDALLAGVGLSAFNDDESTRIITAGFLSPGGGTGPVELATCTFNGSQPTAGDFTIIVTEAVATDFTALIPTPSVSVSSISQLP